MARCTSLLEDATFRSDIVDVLEDISKDTRDLLIGNHVKVYNVNLDPIQFLRDHVGCSQPCLVREEKTVQTWPALSRWRSDQYLVDTLNDVSVTVALTPDGLADCPHVDVAKDSHATFALPQYLQMPFTRFHALLSERNGTMVPYLQQQNSSLTTELSLLLGDVGRIPWADDTLVNLDALNFWMGRYPTRTSWHRDHFENMYVVLRGCKIVRLLPPTDSYRMKLKAYSQSTWSSADDGTFSTWTLKPTQDDALLWSSLMPCTCLESRIDGLCSSCRHLYPNMPLEIEVHAGDVLYIPATWYHEIHHKDTGETTIAINFWYDMIHDAKYASMLAVDKIAQILKMNESL